MKNFLIRYWRSCAGFVLILTVWVGLTELHLVKSFRLPPPLQVIQAAFDVKNELLQHIEATTARLLAGYVLGVTLGLAGGFALRYSSKLNEIAYPVIESWRPVPTVALVPFFILWFGFSEFGRIFLISLGVAFIMLISTYEAIGNLKPIYVKAAYSLGASKRQVFTTIFLPGILPELRSGLRISIAIGFGLVVVAEMMGADYGLGQLIDIARRTFSTQTIILAIFIIGIIALILDKLVQMILNRLTRWAGSAQDAIQTKQKADL
jgi:ABC-type nitrate/sulfonate/bicarbonate transport system permease component